MPMSPPRSRPARHRLQRLVVGAVAVAASLAATGVASAHQTAIGNRVAVEMHVAPDDAPVAGRPATVSIVSVTPPKGGRFSFASGRARLRITDGSGRVVTSRRTGKRTRVTFPRAGAYEIRFSGRYRTSGKTRSFSTRFVIRAS